MSIKLLLLDYSLLNLEILVLAKRANGYVHYLVCDKTNEFIPSSRVGHISNIRDKAIGGSQINLWPTQKQISG